MSVVILVSVVILSVVILSVVILCVVILCVVILICVCRDFVCACRDFCRDFGWSHNCRRIGSDCGYSDEAGIYGKVVREVGSG